jgi:hypothetical protein
MVLASLWLPLFSRLAVTDLLIGSSYPGTSHSNRMETAEVERKWRDQSGRPSEGELHRLRRALNKAWSIG